MRMLWKRIARSPQPASDRLHFVMFDFLKMFAAAILLGALFSVLAASVVLMLSASRDANAGAWVDRDGLKVLKQEVQTAQTTQTAQVSNAEQGAFIQAAFDVREPEARSDNVLPDFPATPGSLFLGEGCGSDLLTAIEREWYVTVEEKHVEVQVMQTFLLPLAQPGTDSDDVLNARFYAQLPKGATYSHFRVDTEGGVALGHKSDDANWDADDATTAMTLAKRGVIRIFAYQSHGAHGADGVNTLSSDIVAGVRAGETVIVTYRYRVPHHNVTRSGETLISVALNEPREDEETFVPGGGVTSRNGTNDFTHEPEEASPTRPFTTGTVWVEWKAHAPNKITDMPHGSVIERTPVTAKGAKPASRITGLSWTTSRLDGLDQFQLAWR